MTHSENYIHKCSLPPTGRHIPGPCEQGNTVAVSKQHGLCLFNNFGKPLFPDSVLQICNNRVRDYRAGSCGGWDKCRSTKQHFL